LEFALTDDVKNRHLESESRRALFSVRVGVHQTWGDISTEMIASARKTIDEVLCKEAEWMELTEAERIMLED
jgi:hypothetical protein